MASRDSAISPARQPASRIMRKVFATSCFASGFDMNRDRVCAGFDKTRRVMIGMLDHEMNVERKLCLFAHGRDHGRAKRNVVDEMAIHDVEMDPIGAGFFNALRFLGELEKSAARMEGATRICDMSAKQWSNINGNAQRPLQTTAFALTREMSVSRCYPISAGRIALQRTNAAMSRSLGCASDGLEARD